MIMMVVVKMIMFISRHNAKTVIDVYMYNIISKQTVHVVSLRIEGCPGC